MENTENKKSFLKSFLDGLYFKNPLLSLFLGLTLAVLATNRLQTSLMIGLIVIITMFITLSVISLLRKHLDKVTATIAAAIISAGLASIFAMLIDSLLPGLMNAEESKYKLVLFTVIPFVSTTSLVLAKSEECLSRSYSETVADVLGSGLGYVLALALIAVIREILSTGAITFVDNAGKLYGPILFKSGYIKMFADPFGGLLFVGLFAGIHGTVLHLISKKSMNKEEK